MRDGFRKVAQVLSDAVASAGAVLAALGIVLVWICTGPVFHYSDT
jgi:low affinity Fe/Cu permease